MYHGKPCWFELSTAKGALDDAGAFYDKVFGWKISDAGMPGFTYHLAHYDGGPVAGLMERPEDCADVPPFWMIYFDVDDADGAAAKVKALGGKVFREPADIPETGRFAVLSDPQGVGFGILQPLGMDPKPPADAGPWNQQKESHGNWIELMSTDPGAAFDFYAELFGWTKDEALDMGAMGRYQLFAAGGPAIGGMMTKPAEVPAPFWSYYFRVDAVGAALERLKKEGGQVINGPMEVPGGDWIVQGIDPQGAMFSLVSRKA